MTKVQRIFQIGDFKTRQEALAKRRLSIDELFNMWNSRVKVSSGEAITSGFLNAAVLAFEWLLQRDSTRSYIMQAMPYLSVTCARFALARLLAVVSFMFSRALVMRRRRRSLAKRLPGIPL